MNIIRRAALPLFLVLMVSAVSVYFYVSGENLSVAVLEGDKSPKTVIIDAGHGGLTNTID